MDTTEEKKSVGIPLINQKAPDFEAPTTHGVKKLSDYAGKWLVLFSHPADFTPVCTTEFVGFAKHADDFKKINTELLGLSVDGIQSHIAWVRNIEENFGVKITFPIIADLSMDVASKFGMIHPGASNTSAVRAVFVIDPDSILRAMVYYPLSNGRAIPEILRLVQALQTSDTNKCATPEGWQPGDKVIVPPPATVEAAEKRKDEGYEYIDWYISKRSL